MGAVPVGPLALPWSVLWLLAAVVTALAVNSGLRQRGRASAETALWWLLLSALMIARAVFVLRWWPHYATYPLGMLDFRDGGWSPWAGLSGLVVVAAWIGWRRQALRVPLALALASGVLVWALGHGVSWRLLEASRVPLPTLVLNDLDGHPRALQEIKGQPVVINLWATWCGPCRREMPVLERARQDYPGIRFVLANQGESAQVIRDFLAGNGLGRDGVLLDPYSGLSQQFGVRGYPTTLFFDARGLLRSSRVGELSAATLAAELRQLSDDTAATVPR